MKNNFENLNSDLPETSSQKMNLEENPLVSNENIHEIFPNFTSGLTEGIFGCVDSFDGTKISGWYFNVKNPESSLLSFRINNIEIGTVTPKNFRPDISELAGYSVYCGFEFNGTHLKSEVSSKIDELFPDSKDLAIQVYCATTSRSIFQHGLCVITKEEFFNFSQQQALLNTGSAKKNIYSSESSENELVGRANKPLRKIQPIPKKNTKANGEFIGMSSRRVYGTLLIDLKIFEATRTNLELDFYLDGEVLRETKSNINLRQLEGQFALLDFSFPLPKEKLDGNQHAIDFSFKNSNVFLNKKSFVIGPKNFDSNIEYVGGGRIRGYFVERINSIKPLEISIKIDEDDDFFINCDKPIVNNLSKDSTQQYGGFSFQLEQKYLDGLPHLVIMKHDGEIICSTYALFSQRSHLDTINTNEIAGWIYDSSVTAKNPPIELDLYINEKLVDTFFADLSRGDVGRSCGFYFNISEYTKNRASFTLSLTLANSTQNVLKTPLVYNRRDSFIEIIRSLSQKARDGELGLSKNESIAFSRYLGKKLISDIRHSHLENAYLSGADHIKNQYPVNVIIPVYDGIAETAKCLAELYKTYDFNKTDFTVTIIDDCGPEPTMHALLQKFSSHGKTKLICNERNLGFVSSVNKALALSKDRDVVLLNADAVVANDWLDRLQVAAYSSDSVASVTPFSNNATVCSYPDPLLENSMPKDISLSEIDQICKEVNHEQVLEIPSGIGFCMYMRADAIAEVGLLDAERFGQGYGEENDWCIRARDLGWKHLHACDIFVEHIGGVSFGQDKKSSLVEKNLKILTEIYPEYTPIVMDFLHKDPARLPRNKISIRRISDRLASFKTTVLHISHSFGGGIEVFCNDEKVRLASENTATITLESRGENEFALKYEDLEATYKRDTDFPALLCDLAALSCSLVHINSDIGFDLDIWDIPKKLKIPFQVTIHDYTIVCPRVNFTIKSGNYCGEPTNPESCNRCISTNGTYPYLEQRFSDLNSDILDWRAFYHQQLKRAKSIFVPDEDVAIRVKRYFPELVTEIRPHLEEPKAAIQWPALGSGDILKIAVIGAIGPHKGVNILRSCIENANLMGLPLHFTIIGYTSCDQQLRSFPNVTITGKYEPEQLQDIIEQQSPHVALFISPWPETYSYTLSEALSAKLWPVVLPIGAQASRVKKLQFGSVLGEGSNADQINSQLMELAFSSAPKSRAGKGKGRTVI